VKLTRTLLRGATALLGVDLAFDGRPLDVLVESASRRLSACASA
jgi:hypothetical protein